MDSYYKELMKGQVAQTANDQMDSRAYSNVLLKDYLDAINKRQGGIDARRAEMPNQAPIEPGYSNVNLKPLTAFVDSMTGSRLTQGYTPPPSAEDQNDLRLRLQNALAKEEQSLIDDKLNVTRMLTEDDRVRARMGQQDEDRDLDRALKMEMLRERLAANKEIADKKAEEKKNKPEKVTADQSKAAGFARRIEQTDGIFDELVGQGYLGPSRSDQLKAFGPNELRSPLYQQYDQAARNFINATLRRESGAAIGKDEFANAKAQYLPQPGDSPEVLRQKKANRAQIRENLKAEAQSAYDRTPLVTGGDLNIPQSSKIIYSNGSDTYEVDPNDMQAIRDLEADGFQRVK